MWEYSRGESAARRARGDEGRAQPPREGTAVAERRLAQLFRQLVLPMLRLLGTTFPGHKHALRASSAPTAVSLRGSLYAGSWPAGSQNDREAPLGTAHEFALQSQPVSLGAAGGFIVRVGSEVGDARPAAKPYTALG